MIACLHCHGAVLVERDIVTGLEGRCLQCGRTHLPAGWAPLPLVQTGRSKSAPPTTTIASGRCEWCGDPAGVNQQRPDRVRRFCSTRCSEASNWRRRYQRKQAQRQAVS